MAYGGAGNELRDDLIKSVNGEALAINHGLTVVRVQGWQEVILESDCLEVAHQLTSESRSLVAFGAITQFICRTATC